MKRFIILSFLSFLLLDVYSQRSEVDYVNIEEAVKSKASLNDLVIDFANKETKLVIILDEDMDEAAITKVKNSLEWLNPKVPKKVFALEEATEGGKNVLIIDFPKNKLNSMPEGGELVLRTVAKPKFEIAKIINKKGEGGSPQPLGENNGTASPAPEKIPYWNYQPAYKVNLQEYKIPYDFCCDTCRTCEDTMLLYNNRIIYDAISGLTQYIPYDFSSIFRGDSIHNVHCNICPPGAQIRAGRQGYIVRNGHPIVLKAGDPLVYIVKNVNPYLYDVALSDSAFFINNESTSLLENMLFAKHGIAPQADKGKKLKADDSIYLAMKTGLIALRAEMGELLENYRVMSRFAHNCIEEKKRQALGAINHFLVDLGKDQQQSFSAFVDIYLNPTTTDSTLNKSLKAMYGEFWRSKYVIAYRFQEVPAFDQVNFKLSIRRKSDSPYPDLLTPSNYAHQTAYVKNFLKIDVSSGLYFAGFGNKEFTTRADSNLAVTPQIRGTRIIKENAGNREFGFASYLHFYYKTGVGFNAGLHIGAGINFKDDPQPRYFTGGSLMFGNNNRLCVNSGLIWGNVKVLSDQYPREADGSYKWLPPGETELVVQNKFRNSWFVSISYNLPFLKRNKGTAEVKPPPKVEEAEKPKKEGASAKGGEGEDGTSSTENLKSKKTVIKDQK